MKRDGFVLVLALLMISVLVLVVTRVFLQSSSTYTLSTILVRREKAKMLALSGVQLAISNLTIEVEKAPKQEGEVQKQQPQQQKGAPKESPKKKYYKKLLEKILPKFNKLNVIEFKEKEDGFDGEINFSISAENGKINLNYFYDFEKHQFKKPEYEEIFDQLFKFISVATNEKNYSSIFKKFLHDRKFPINDITEVLAEPGLDYFKKYVFYDPESKEQQFYLTDLFTTYSNNEKLEPWLLSNSIIKVFGFKNITEVKQREQMVPDWLKNFKEKSEWLKDWNVELKPVYDKSYENIPKNLINIFETTFTPQKFSVISIGRVGDVIQKVYAILQFNENQDKVIISLEKLYWI